MTKTSRLARTKHDMTFPNFSPDAPPKDWERQHAGPRAFGSPAFRKNLNGARPVPRLASHHYASDRLPGYASKRDTRSTFVFA